MTGMKPWAAPLCLALAFTTGGCFATDAAANQLRLINRQVPIAVARQRETDRERRWMLAEVPRVLRFAREVMALRPGASYRGYVATEQEGLTYVLSACRRTRFEAHAWWFPIAGEVPYKSYFSRGDAEAAARRLEASGYDTWVSPSRAYSTLGILRDPVVTTMMRDGPVAFVEVLLHELTHAKLYVPGQTEFNEQLASFVAQQGVARYFASPRFSNTSALQQVADGKRRRAKVESAVFATIEALEDLYTRDLAEPVVLERKARHLRALEETLTALLPTADPRRLHMNNAALMQYRRYGRSADYLEDLWEQAQGNFRSFWPLARAHATAL